MTSGSPQRKAIAVLAALVLLAVATSPVWTIVLIKGRATQIVDDTLPGLVSSSLANTSIAESFLATTLAVESADPKVREESIRKISVMTTQTDIQLEIYAALIEDRGDRAKYDKLIGARDRYRETRAEVVALLASDRREEALRLFNRTCLAQFSEYISALNEMLVANVDEARQRGKDIMRWCNILLIVQGALMIFFVLYAFFVPFMLLMERVRTGSRVVTEI